MPTVFVNDQLMDSIKNNEHNCTNVQAYSKSGLFRLLQIDDSIIISNGVKDMLGRQCNIDLVFMHHIGAAPFNKQNVFQIVARANKFC